MSETKPFYLMLEFDGVLPGQTLQTSFRNIHRNIEDIFEGIFKYSFYLEDPRREGVSAARVETHARSISKAEEKEGVTDDGSNLMIEWPDSRPVEYPTFANIPFGDLFVFPQEFEAHKREVYIKDGGGCATSLVTGLRRSTRDGCLVCPVKATLKIESKVLFA